MRKLYSFTHLESSLEEEAPWVWRYFRVPAVCVWVCVRVSSRPEEGWWRWRRSKSRWAPSQQGELAFSAPSPRRPSRPRSAWWARGTSCMNERDSCSFSLSVCCSSVSSMFLQCASRVLSLHSCHRAKHLFSFNNTDSAFSPQGSFSSFSGAFHRITGSHSDTEVCFKGKQINCQSFFNYNSTTNGQLHLLRKTVWYPKTLEQRLNQEWTFCFECISKIEWPHPS